VKRARELVGRDKRAKTRSQRQELTVMVKVWPLEDWGPLRGASVMNFNVKTIEIFSLDKDIFF